MTLKTNAVSIYILNIRNWINIIKRTYIYRSIFKVKEKLVTE